MVAVSEPMKLLVAAVVQVVLLPVALPIQQARLGRLALLVILAAQGARVLALLARLVAGLEGLPLIVRLAIPELLQVAQAGAQVIITAMVVMEQEAKYYLRLQMVAVHRQRQLRPRLLRLCQHLPPRPLQCQRQLPPPNLRPRLLQHHHQAPV